MVVPPGERQTQPCEPPGEHEEGADHAGGVTSPRIPRCCAGEQLPCRAPVGAAPHVVVLVVRYNTLCVVRVPAHSPPFAPHQHEDPVDGGGLRGARAAFGVAAAGEGAAPSRARGWVGLTVAQQRRRGRSGGARVPSAWSTGRHNEWRMRVPGGHIKIPGMAASQVLKLSCRTLLVPFQGRPWKDWCLEGPVWCSLKGPSLKGSGKCVNCGPAGSFWEHAGVAAIPGILVRLPGRTTSPPMCGLIKCGQVYGRIKSGQIKSNERAKKKERSTGERSN
eukprot:gene15435-biopygen5194